MCCQTNLIFMGIKTKMWIKILSSFPFVQPEQLRSVIDLSIPEEPLPLDQLIVDCRDTLKHQVKTGRKLFAISTFANTSGMFPYLSCGWVGGWQISEWSIHSKSHGCQQQGSQGGERGFSATTVLPIPSLLTRNRGANHPRTTLLLRVSLLGNNNI